MLIEIKGVQFVNKGAELMLHAIMQSIESEFSDVSFVLEVYESSPYEERAKLATLQKFSLRSGRLDLNFVSYLLPKPLKRFARRFGVVFECDVDVVLDASGFSYGDQWPDMTVERMVSELKRYKKHGKKYIFMPQAFGPFTRKTTVSALQNHLAKSSLVLAREDSSYQYIRDIAPDLDNLEQFPDFTNLVKGITSEDYQGIAGSVIIVPNNNMISARNNNTGWFSSYEDTMVALGEEALAKAVPVVILNHEGPADKLICESLSARLGGVRIVSEQNPLMVKGILGSAKAVISSRFHGCVSALSQGVPCLGTSWSHKYERLYDEYGVREWLIPEKDTDSKSLIESVLYDDTARERVVRASESLKKLSRTMWKRVFEVIDVK